ncbi:MAG: thiamine diphosphokinase [Acidimicrobiia bacterium]
MDGTDAAGAITAIVCTGGVSSRSESGADASIGDSLPAHDLVIAADSGLHLAHELGLAVDVAVGDFDSASPAAVASAERTGVVVERHPADKDRTDLELALDAAVGRGATHLVVVGIDGGRPDHELANLLLLGSHKYRSVAIETLSPSARAVVVTGSATLPGTVGDLVSLLPLGGGARGVRTSGLEFALAGDNLEPGTTRGVSNIIESAPATVSVTGGTLLAVLPHEVS